MHRLGNFSLARKSTFVLGPIGPVECIHFRLSRLLIVTGLNDGRRHMNVACAALGIAAARNLICNALPYTSLHQVFTDNAVNLPLLLATNMLHGNLDLRINTITAELSNWSVELKQLLPDEHF